MCTNVPLLLSFIALSESQHTSFVVLPKRQRTSFIASGFNPDNNFWIILGNFGLTLPLTEGGRGVSCFVGLLPLVFASS